MENHLFEERKQKVYQFICSEWYVPMKIKELAIMLEVSKEDRLQLERILEELQEEGRIILTKRGKYAKSEETKVTGVFHGTTKGFGFVEVEGEPEDIFIPENRTAGAMHQDMVEVSVHPILTGKRREGSVIRIVERGIRKVVCTYEASENFGFALPDNQRFAKDIFIPKEHSMGAVSGHKVVVEITDYGTGEDREHGLRGRAVRNPEGRIVEILGHINDPGIDILSIVRAYDLPVEFPEKVMNQVQRVAKEVSEADMARRMDLRGVQMVTIDGEDAKDLDDAVSLQMEGQNYVLGVHIADVANYVQENSALDREALDRGTSVYLVDRVIPMLPHALSNGICSLNEGQVRLAMSCIMTINPKGEVIDHVITESVIQVDRRMSYTNVKKLLELQEMQEREEKCVLDPAEQELWDSHRSLMPMFVKMAELAEILRRRRMKRGSIDFDFPETKVSLDEEGHPIAIRPYDRNVATRLIEDFMLAANETVAQDAFWQELPFVYRTHDKPDLEKIQSLAAWIRNFGYTLHVGTDEVHPKELQKLLTKIEGSKEEALISRLTLRSMKQARYTTACTGHFGLAAAYYCHFTSPIRRYPDLQIHRILKDNLRGRMNEKRVDHYQKILAKVADQSSKTERRAEEAERETVKLKKVEYMQAHLGEVFEGVISGVTEWGFFVELTNTVEGLVRVANLVDDFYRYHEDSYELLGERTGKSYKLGQNVLVRVEKTDRQTRTIDFSVVEE